ncbi:MAG TPA: hypothetical protein VF428_03090 [Casimicrobiaceae bacterium]
MTSFHCTWFAPCAPDPDDPTVLHAATRIADPSAANDDGFMLRASDAELR